MLQDFESNNNIREEFDVKNEAFLNHCRLYDSNHKKSKNKITLKEDLLKVFI